MIVRLTKSKKDIFVILNDDDIYNRMASDSRTGEKPFIVFDNNHKYVIGFVDNKPIGLCIYCKKPSGNIIHFYVLPKCRYKYAKEFAEKALEFKYNGSVFAITPECYMSVVNFALKLGFKECGIHNDTFIKNSKKYKQIITRFDK